MNCRRILLVGLFQLFLHPAPIPAGGDDGFRPMFNGKDLTGWVNVNCHPKTFFVKDNMIVTTGRPTGFLRTEKQYENFIAEFDWLHVNTKEVGNSGFFVWADPVPAQGTGYTRGIEVQVLVNLHWKDKEGRSTATSHGDLFSIWGARCKPDRPHPLGWERSIPSENRAKGGGEWNHYKITGKDGMLSLEVNGKEVSRVTECNPRKGYLALESEGAETWFKNLKIKELPSSGPTFADAPSACCCTQRRRAFVLFPRLFSRRSANSACCDWSASPSSNLRPDEIADIDRGLRSLYTGLDLDGWKHDPGHVNHWRPSDWVLRYDGKSEAKDKNLWSAKEYGDFELMCDWRFPGKPQKMKRPVILPNGDYDLDGKGDKKEVEVLDAGDSGIYLRGNDKSQVNIWCWPIGSGEVYGYRTDKSMPASVRAGVTPKMRADLPLGQWNRLFITMKGDRLTVKLNGKLVIENAQLPGVPARGPIALQHHGDPIEFANLFIRELKD